MKKINISKQKLEKLYYEKGLTIFQIAKILGCSNTPILNRFKEYNLKTRTNSETKIKYNIPYKKLKELYCIQKLSCEKIAKIFNCDSEVIRKRLNKYKIRVKGQNEYPSCMKGKHHALKTKKKISKTKKEKYILGSIDKYIIPKKELKNLYYNKKLTFKKIAKLFNCSFAVILNRFNRYGLKPRDRKARIINPSKYWKNKKFSDIHIKNLSSSHIGKNCGKDHPNWQGGISFEPYSPEFNEEFKEEIRERDGRKCWFPGCGIPEAECLTKIPVHHIDYIKKNTYPENAICLCNKHNIQVNSNRKYWKRYFQNLMIKRMEEQYLKEK